MVKVRVTSRGIITEPGDGFEAAPTSTPSRTITSDTSLTTADVGLIVMSASAGVVTGTMPDTAAAAGAMFIFRSTSPSAHVLTASAGDGNCFVERSSNPVGNVTGSHGDKVIFPALAGSSVVMVSDGANWLITGGSGSFSLQANAV